MDILILVSLMTATCTGLIVWLVIDLGTRTFHNYRASFTEETAFRAREFFLFLDARQLFLGNLVLMVAGALLTLLLTGQLGMALLVAAVMASTPRWTYRLMRTRRLQRFERQLPDALMVISGGIRAGSSFSAAIGQMAREAESPLAEEFQLMLREQRLGVSMDHSLAHLSRRVPTQSTTLVVSAMRIAHETGGGLAETLERTAHTLRARIQMESKIGALTAQGKLQAWVVGLLPLFLLVVLHQMEPESMAMLWSTTQGWVVLTVLTLLEMMGILLIRKIVSIDV